MKIRIPKFIGWLDCDSNVEWVDNIDNLTYEQSKFVSDVQSNEFLEIDYDEAYDNDEFEKRYLSKGMLDDD